MTPRPISRLTRLPRIDGAPGPAERLDGAAAAALVDAALARHQRSAHGGSRLWRYAAAAAIVCGLAGVSAAAIVGVHAWRAERSGAAVPETRARRPAMGAAPSAPQVDEEPAFPRAEPPAPVAPTETRHLGRGPTSTDLLEEANRLRRHGDWRAAERLYARVGSSAGERWPRYIAIAAAASIRLEHLGDSRGALRLYRQARAVRPGGELEPEILWGLAACERALGAPAEEAAALRELTARHPGSPFHGPAERRLTELSSPPAL